MKKRFVFRLFLILLALALLLPAFISLRAYAAGGTATIGLSAREVYLGNHVYVTVTYTSATPMATWSFGIEYDSDKLQYVSGAQSTTGGTLNFVDQPASGGVTSKSYTITFKTVALGEARISTVTREVYAEDYSSISVSEASRTVSIVNRPAASWENRLSALTCEGFAFTPDFDPDVTRYSGEVPYSVTGLKFAASAKHSAASVRVSGADELAEGENTVQITVTAENGNTRTYTVVVNRKASNLFAEQVTVEGDSYLFPRDPSEVTAPAGFAPVEGTYNGKSVLFYENAASSLKLAVLITQTSAESASKAFLYDEASGEFYPYFEVETVPQKYVFVKKPQNVSVPEGFVPSILVVAGVEQDAWEKNDVTLSSPQTLVYAAPIDGSPAFYRYDRKSGDFTLYFEPQTVTPQEGENEELKAALSEAVEEKGELLRYFNYAVLIAGAVILILIILVIVFAVLAARRGKRREQQEELPLYYPPATVAREDVPQEQTPYFLPQEISSVAEETVSFTAAAPTQEIPPLPKKEEPVLAEDAAALVAALAATSGEEKGSRSVPIWEELGTIEPLSELTPSRQRRESAPKSASAVPAEERRGHPEIERIFNGESDEDVFRKNNPIIDEDEEDGGDAPIFGFDEE
ncbi:MAG: cadherin-like beta sandwich domain-containing protein [Clostridia bacterium]|nr:cadherin-like beta sandwich domain-containing protein [Clostridia bacterium]